MSTPGADASSPLSGVWAVVVGAGSGQRFGGAKQYATLAGERVLDWSVSAARSACEGVVLVVPPTHVSDPEPGVDAVVAGAPTRSGSVRAGLSAVPDSAEVIVVHDAARPLATPELFHRVIAAVRSGADAALPGVPVADTIRQVGGGVVDRSELVAIQTPQAFGAAILRAAHQGNGEATDDGALVEQVGGRVEIVPGETRNAKITDPDDLVVAEALLAAREAGAG